MIVEYSLSSLGRYNGSVDTGSSSSFSKVMGVISIMALFLKNRSSVVLKKTFLNGSNWFG